MAVTEIKIEGIDTEAGIKRFAGKAEIYIKSLIKFASQYKDSSAPADADELKSFAHQIKGVAANLGINDLSAVAATAEKNLDESSAFIDLLKKTCAKILAEVTPPDTAAAVNPKASSGSAEEYKELIAKFSEALKICNYTQCKTLVGELSKKSWNGVKTPDFRAVMEAVERYDFDAAKELINN